MSGSWNLHSCHDVYLISQECKRRPNISLQFPLNWRDLCNRLTRDARREWCELREITSMLRQSHWHNRQRRHTRIKLQQVIDGAFQMCSVVKPRTQDHLAMHLNAGFRQTLDFRHETIILID